MGSASGVGVCFRGGLLAQLAVQRLPAAGLQEPFLVVVAAIPRARDAQLGNSTYRRCRGFMAAVIATVVEPLDGI